MSKQTLARLQIYGGIVVVQRRAETRDLLRRAGLTEGETSAVLVAFKDYIWDRSWSRIRVYAVAATLSFATLLLLTPRSFQGTWWSASALVIFIVLVMLLHAYYQRCSFRVCLTSIVALAGLAVVYSHLMSPPLIGPVFEGDSGSSSRDRRRKVGMDFFAEGYRLRIHFLRELQLLPWILALEITYLTLGHREKTVAATNEFARSLHAYASNTSDLRLAQESRSACVDLVKGIFEPASRSIARLRFATRAPVLPARRVWFAGIQAVLAPPVVAAVITGLIAIMIKVVWPN